MTLNSYTDIGLSEDFFVTNVAVQHFFFLRPGVVEFLYREDGIVEPDETFMIVLESDSEIALRTGPGVFFRQTLQCVIVDGDGEINHKRFIVIMTSALTVSSSILN